jgi:hypothetical protein
MSYFFGEAGCPDALGRRHRRKIDCAIAAINPATNQKLQVSDPLSEAISPRRAGLIGQEIDIETSYLVGKT